MNVLVTGTAGFIGFHLANRLVDAGERVFGLDNINDYYDVKLKYDRLQQAGIKEEEIVYGKMTRSVVHKEYRFIKLNLEDQEGILDLFASERFDVVINLAAQAGVRYSLKNPFAYIDSNVKGFMNVLEGSRRSDVGHLVYASSSSVYGLNAVLPLSTHHPADHPISLYAATKKANEMMAHSYSHLYDLPTTGLRFFTVYGPWGRPDMALFLFTKAILDGKPIDVFNNGNMERDFTYIDDIVEGVARVSAKPPQRNQSWDAQNTDPSTSSAPFRIYNIGNSNKVKLTDYIDALELSLGKKTTRNLLPMQPGDVPATQADVSDLIREFGYKPSTSISKGIEAFVKWYLDYFKTR